jgi:hypothetical protein
MSWLHCYRSSCQREFDPTPIMIIKSYVPMQDRATITSLDRIHETCQNHHNDGAQIPSEDISVGRGGSTKVEWRYELEGILDQI